jgi:hypothetical protein
LRSKQQKASNVSSRIGIFFLTSGVLSFISSVLSANHALALIGLGLVFWGALFLLVSPMRHVEGSLLYSTIVSSYSSIDRMLNDLLNYNSKYFTPPYYLPPYPAGDYLPEHLQGLRDMVVFVSLDSDNAMPSVDEMAKSKFLLKKPKGLLITPPGLGLLEQIEAAANVDFSGIGIIKACDMLPRIISENFGLAEKIEIEFAEGQAKLKILDSVYKNLYSDKNNLKSVWLLGCPIASAIACVFAKASGKTVIILEQRLSDKDSAIEVRYSLLER